MRYWDSSAIVPLLVDEKLTELAQQYYRDDPIVLVWWGTHVECASAIARRERERVLDLQMANQALGQLKRLAEHWHEVLPTSRLRWMAERLLRVHPLRAADSLQLAAAYHASNQKPESLPLLSFDQRLTEAAMREGFQVVTAG